MRQDLEAAIEGRWFKGGNCSSQLQYEEAEGTIFIFITIFFTSEEGDIITWVWALPLATSKLGGGAPISYHHHTPIFTVFLSSILLVISCSSRIKALVWSSFEFCFMILLCNRVRELYIIKISVESRAWLSCYDREGIKERERIKRSKDIISILWRVMTSHIKSMMNKSCWELTNIVVGIVAINRK